MIQSIVFFTLGVGLVCVICLIKSLLKKNSVDKNSDKAENASSGIAMQELVQSMCRIYTVCLYLDIEKDELVDLSAHSQFQKIINDFGTTSKKIRSICNLFVSPEFLDDMIRFTDLSTLDERLKDKDVITQDYKNVNLGWCKGFLIVAKRNANGTLKQLFFTSRVIQDEKEREEIQSKNLAAALTAAKSANRAKSAFLFNMSHDIRTPMNAIIGFTDLLEKNLDDKEKTVDYIKKIQSSNATLLTLVNNVLEMARIESGRTIVEEEYWDLRLFNNTLVSIYADTIKKHGLNFSKSLDLQHYHVLCDTPKIQKIFLNLMSNAIKFTPAGGHIKFDMTEIPCEKEGVALFKTVVEDDGIGMSEEYLKSIFDQFSKERSSTESGIEGSGMGMAIVKNLVNLLEGTVNVESAPGKGTKVTVTLPLKIATAEDIEIPEKEAQELKRKDFSNKRVLLAEDNDLNAEIASTILKEAGMAVDRVENGKECYDLLNNTEAGRYDIILMDIQMPIMNGYEATREIRALGDPKKSEIPIVAMTANAFDEDRGSSLIAGMNAHLSKPIDVSELFKTLNKFI